MQKIKLTCFAKQEHFEEMKKTLLYCLGYKTLQISFPFGTYRWNEPKRLELPNRLRRTGSILPLDPRGLVEFMSDWVTVILRPAPYQTDVLVYHCKYTSIKIQHVCFP